MLRDARYRAPLCQALADCDRLILLGDLLELRHGPLHEALAAAREPLGAIAAALPAGAEVVILAGNHDHFLVEPWLARRAVGGPPPRLGLQSAVDWQAGEPLAELARMLAPARVSAAYPGVWLRDDVWATHGHYLDLHMTIPSIERLGAGVMRRIVAARGSEPAAAEDYEAILGPLYAWLHAVAQGAHPGRGSGMQGGSIKGWQALTGAPHRRRMRARLAAVAWPVVIGALNRAGLGPLGPELSGHALRGSGLRGIDEVCACLGVTAGHVIFGHTHRAGPLPGDDHAEWVSARGVQLINSGCWVHEPAFMGSDPARSPYRVAFAVSLEGDAPPRLVNLLSEPVGSDPPDQRRG